MEERLLVMLEVFSWAKLESVLFALGGCIRLLSRIGPVLLTTVKASCV